jgi:hypothetical protein
MQLNGDIGTEVERVDRQLEYRREPEPVSGPKAADRRAFELDVEQLEAHRHTGVVESRDADVGALGPRVAGIQIEEPLGGSLNGNGNIRNSAGCVSVYPVTAMRRERSETRSWSRW